MQIFTDISKIAIVSVLEVRLQLPHNLCL